MTSLVRCVGCGFKMYLLCCSDLHRDQQALCQQCYNRQAQTQATCDHCNRSLATHSNPEPPQLHRSSSQGSFMQPVSYQQGRNQSHHWPGFNQHQQSHFGQAPHQPLLGQKFGASQGFFGRSNYREEDDYNEEEVKLALTRVYEAPLVQDGAMRKERRKNGLPPETPVECDTDTVWSWSTLKGGN